MMVERLENNNCQVCYKASLLLKDKFKTKYISGYIINNVGIIKTLLGLATDLYQKGVSFYTSLHYLI